MPPRRSTRPAAAAAAAAPANTPGGPMPFLEYGESGISSYGGRLNEEFIPELKGDRGRRVIREMAWNDAIFGAALFVIRMLLRRAPISVEPGGTSPQDLLAHDLVSTALQDMSLTWEDTLSDICTMFPFGWAYLEVIYKHRIGPMETDGSRRSEQTDGLIGWRKWALRSQLSLDRWELDASGGVQAMVQRPTMSTTARPVAQRPPGAGFGMGLVIPISKALLFKTDNAGGSPEGTSVLRNAYKAYYFAKRIEMLEGIGIERDMAGMPELKIPAKFLDPSASPADKAVGEAYRKMGEQIRNDRMSSVLIPSDRDDKGNALYEFNLKGANGRRQFDTDKVLGRYALQKAMVMLADFILLGHEKVGSFALSTDKTALFGIALGAWRDSILAVINRHEIQRRLLPLNGIRVEKPPRLVGGEIIAPSLGELAKMIGELAGIGMPLFPDDALENAIRGRMGLPAKEAADTEHAAADGGGEDDGYFVDDGGNATADKRRRRPRPMPLRGRVYKVGSSRWAAELDEILGSKAGDAFDESEHPRHPRGAHDGGKFSPKAGGAEDAAAEGLTELASPLDADEIEAANQYKGFKYVFINGHLRGTLAGELSTTDRAVVEGEIAALDQAIEKSRTREDMVVYRGVTDATLAKNWKRADVLVGREVSGPAFVSVAADPVIAERYSQREESILYEITVPAGTNALDMSAHATRLKQYAYENELLLGRNQRFRVTAVEKRGKRRVLKMEAIP